MGVGLAQDPMWIAGRTERRQDVNILWLIEQLNPDDVVDTSKLLGEEREDFNCFIHIGRVVE